MGAEKQFENKVKKYLKDQGCWYVKYWSGNARNGKKFTRDGIPDLLVCCNGYFMALELKAENGHPTKLQKWNIRQINYAGGLAFTLYPDQFDEFKDLILSLQRGYGRTVTSYVKDFNERWMKK